MLSSIRPRNSMAISTAPVHFSLGDNDELDRNTTSTHITTTITTTISDSVNNTGSSTSPTDDEESSVDHYSYQPFQTTEAEDQCISRIPSDLQAQIQQDSAFFSAGLGSGYPLTPFKSKGNMAPISIQTNNMLGVGGENFAEVKLKSLAEHVVTTLTTNHGICVLDKFLDEKRGLDILEEVLGMHSSGQFQDGQVVRSRDDHDSRKIRGDQITWRNGDEPGCENISFLISILDSILDLCNGQLEDYDINGRTKAMIACYPGNGTHYVRHVDNPNNDGRCITCIYYLNRKWDVKKSGGLLRVYPEGAKRNANIAPFFNRILFFYSDRRNPHEVFPAFDTRYAITIWYLDGNQKSKVGIPIKI